MISDTLSDAVDAIREYLEHPATKDCYVGRVRRRIVLLAADMDAVRAELDSPPPRTDSGGVRIDLLLFAAIVLVTTWIYAHWMPRP